MPLLWLLFGLTIGFAIGVIRANALETQNREFRSALQNVRTMALFGSHKSIVRAVDSVLEQEAA